MESTLLVTNTYIISSSLYLRNVADTDFLSRRQKIAQLCLERRRELKQKRRDERQEVLQRRLLVPGPRLRLLVGGRRLLPLLRLLRRPVGLHQ